MSLFLSLNFACFLFDKERSWNFIIINIYTHKWFSNCFSTISVFLGGGRKASVTEMESLRAKVQEAYKNLKAKRREEMFEKTFGTGKRKFVQTNDFA